MLKLGVQLHFTSTLSKACHPHTLTKNNTCMKAVLYILFPSIEQHKLSLYNSRGEPVSSTREVQVRWRQADILHPLIEQSGSTSARRHH